MALSATTTVTTGSLFDRQSNRIEEVLNKNIEMFLPTLDPVWEETVVTNQGVIPFDNIGRDMLYIKTYMGSLAGVVEADGNSGSSDIGLYGDEVTNVGSKVQQQLLTTTWPDATRGTMAKPYQLAVPMRSMMTNLMMTLGEMQAEATPAFIGEVIGPKMEGFAKNVAHTLCNYWYTSQNNNYRLAKVTTLTDSGGTIGISNSGDTTFNAGETKTIDLINQTEEAGGTDRFAVGQLVDYHKTSDNSIQNDKPLIVTAVDELKGHVSLTAPTGMSTFTAVAGYIRPAQTTSATSFRGIAGIRSWLKTGIDSIDGTDHNLLGGEKVSGKAIDVETHPEFKSLGITSVGQLTEHKLRKYLSRFHAAKNKYGQYIDCLVASDGVWMSYEATRIGRETIDRTNRLSSVAVGQGSDEGFQFTMDGRTYKGYTSQYVEDGVLYGIRKGGQNFKKIVPPDYTGLQNDPRQAGFVPFKFVAPALTGGANQMPITKSVSNFSQVTEGVQMPGMLRMQLVPDQPAGIILDGVTTDRTFAG